MVGLAWGGVERGGAGGSSRRTSGEGLRPRARPQGPGEGVKDHRTSQRAVGGAFQS